LRGLGVALGQGATFGAPQPRADDAEIVVLADRGGGRTVHELAEDAPGVQVAGPLSELVRQCLTDGDRDWLMLVDDEARPVRLVERAALLRGEPFEHRAFTVGPWMSLRAIARAAARRPARDRLRPLALCDAQGRYAGLLRIERLLDALAA
jgi:hypothetical protein